MERLDVFNQYRPLLFAIAYRMLSTMDVTFWGDGGGQVTAARQPLQGYQKVARFLVAIRQSRLTPAFIPQAVYINHQPGVLNTVDGIPQSTFSFEFSDQHIQAIFAVVNPEKLNGMRL